MLIGLGGLLAGRMGDLWIHFDVFAQLTVHFLIVAVGFLLGIVMPRARVLTAMVLILASFLGISIWTHMVSAGPRIVSTPGAQEVPLRLLQFNTWYDNGRIDEIVGELERNDADVVTLLEFGPNKKPILERMRSRYPYQYSCLAIDYCNLVLLSKYPFAEPPQARVNWDGPPYVQAKFGPELGNLTLFGIHTLRFPHQRAQFTQLANLSKLIETQPAPLVVMGDFNATPFSRQIRTFAQRTGLQRLTYLPSWPARFQLPQLAIDHIFVSSGIRVLEDERTGQNAGSDHHPITLTIGIPH
jgi:endonuclease/exonuclease/phosphatase (EEP) superfamily protein YafD